MIELAQVLDSCKIGSEASCLSAEEISGHSDRIESLSNQIQSMGIFSSNEEWDDVHTNDAPLLLVPFYFAKILEKFQDIPNRSPYLRHASREFTTFLSVSRRLKLMQPDERDDFDNLDEIPNIFSNQSTCRQKKIQHFTRDKECRSRMTRLKFLLGHTCATDNDVNDDLNDEYKREYTKLDIQISIRASFLELSMISQEIEMLSMMQHLPQLVLQLDQEPTGQSHPTTSGITVTRIIKDPLTGQLNQFQTTIKPHHHPLPVQVVSSEEKSDLVLNSEQLRGKGLEDDEDLYDKATEYDRAWDDWKDENPKGIGNKYGK